MVEQKNGSVVREYAGRGRREVLEEQDSCRLSASRRLLRSTSSRPPKRLKSKTRAGSKEIEVYDESSIPFARLSKNVGLPCTRISSMLGTPFTTR
ncbi:MAG: hypothetical protein LBK73_15315 [Treponema sp.]|nr:hypothetical protein [Treponema sp.]